MDSLNKRGQALILTASAEIVRGVRPAAHTFALYFVILSAITPSVVLAVFAAAICLNKPGSKSDLISLLLATASF